MSDNVEKAKQITLEFFTKQKELTKILFSLNEDESKKYYEWDLKRKLEELH